MNILITGVTGMIGKALVRGLSGDHQLTLVGRSKQKIEQIFNGAYPVYVWDELSPQLLSKHDAVINLAGANVGQRRWSKSYKKQIIDSRIETTALLSKHCANLGRASPRLFNASAIGIYGFAPTELQMDSEFDEHTPLPKSSRDFLAEVGINWEKALMPAEIAGAPVVKLRFGVVLNRDEGALSKMLPSFRLGLGAVLGTGQQPISWVALEDVVAAISFLLARPDNTGAFNIVADEVVTQKQFAKTLAKSLGKPYFLNIPAPVVTLLFGQMGKELLLNGQHVKASRLAGVGFKFQYTSLESALRATMGNDRSI